MVGDPNRVRLRDLLKINPPLPPGYFIEIRGFPPEVARDLVRHEGDIRALAFTGDPAARYLVENVL